MNPCETLYCIAGTGNHEIGTNAGSGSDSVRGNTVINCIVRQTSLQLLHGAKTLHHSGGRLLGLESSQGWAMGLVMGIRICGTITEPISTYQDATRTMGTDRSLARRLLICMVWLLAEKERLTP